MPRFRGVAQPGSALRSGRRGPQFESGHPDLLSLPRSILVLYGSAAVLLAAGCGGSSTSRSSQQLSASEFRARANHICNELNRQVQPDLASKSKAAVDRNLGRIDSALAQLKSLNPPASHRATYRDMLTNFQRSIAFVKTNEGHLILLARHLRAHPTDVRAKAEYQQLVRPFAQSAGLAGAAARALGLNACASGLTGSGG
jgi:gas vesicle protein